MLNRQVSMATTLSADVKIAKTPNPPTFETVEEERLHRKQRLASAFRIFAKFGFYEDHSLFDDYTGVVYDMSEGDRIAQTLGHRKAVILQNHGILTVGSTVDEAAWVFITMDRSCQAQLMAEAVGKPRPISHQSAVVAQKQVGNPRVGWFQYQPLWDLIVREQPDLLE